MISAPPGSGFIGNTRLHRFLTLAAYKICRHFRPQHGTVLFISPKLCIKVGYFADVIEAQTMQFIAQNTSIPVPRVYCAFRRKEMTYIVMERIDGEMVGNGWKLRTKESRAHIIDQLKDMIAEMRRIPPPQSMGVASVNGGTLYDCRLPRPATGDRFGPFKNVSDFHLWLRAGCETHNHSEVRELIAMHEQGAWPISFTHGDLSSLNILARGDDVVGIVDWETAGWYPSYWEYTTAWNVNPQNQFWREEVDGFLEPQPGELAMEKLREGCFGDLGA